MIINLSPQRRDDKLSVEVNGDRIRVNGELFNFNPLEEGDIIRAEDIPSDFFCGPVTRKGGEIELTLILPHGADAGEQVRFPLPVVVFEDGPVHMIGQDDDEAPQEVYEEEEVSENVDA